MKKINISYLSIAELLYLKRRVTEQLKWLQTGEFDRGGCPTSSSTLEVLRNLNVEQKTALSLYLSEAALPSESSSYYVDIDITLFKEGELEAVESSFSSNRDYLQLAIWLLHELLVLPPQPAKNTR
jgi:hypothetical protein